MSANSELYTVSGRRVRLGKLLGKGGEAQIFAIDSDHPLALKLYTDGKASLRQAKVNAMISNRLFERNSFAAFPVENVMSKGEFVGFLMKQVLSAKPLHQIITPGDRKTEFPDADFRFLVHVALNFARAIASISDLGVVVGDINESMALVDRNALVTVVDADSFQYRSRGRLYPCLVGKPEYTPPELHRKPFANVERIGNHDAFGLAAIIFEILFMGRHPYAGTFKGSGNQLSIAEAIEQGRFAYSPQRSLTQMEAPPHGPVLTDIPLVMADAFLRAFGLPGSPSSSRPSASDWIDLLGRMKGEIIECTVNQTHYFPRTAPGCPWCRIEGKTGNILFLSRHSIAPSSFNLDAIMAIIENIKSPGPAPELTSLMPTTTGLTVGANVKSLRLQQWARKAGGLALVALALFLMASGLGVAFFLLIPAGVLGFSEPSGLDDFKRRCTEARNTWRNIMDVWGREAGAGSFEDKRESLRRVALSYRRLPSAEREKLRELEVSKRDLQLKKHLESQKLSRANIDGIGDGRKVTLRSFGVETAWDISANKVMSVPGFGPVLTRKLIKWRHTVEGTFKFDPNIPTDPNEIAKVRSALVTRRAAMETTLWQGINELEQLNSKILLARSRYREHQAAYLAMRQAEVDLGRL